MLGEDDEVQLVTLQLTRDADSAVRLCLDLFEFGVVELRLGRLRLRAMWNKRVGARSGRFSRFAFAAGNWSRAVCL